MSYNVKSLSVFERQAKRLIKKYPYDKSEKENLTGIELDDLLQEVPD